MEFELATPDEIEYEQRIAEIWVRGHLKFSGAASKLAIMEFNLNSKGKTAYEICTNKE